MATLPPSGTLCALQVVGVLFVYCFSSFLSSGFLLLSLKTINLVTNIPKAFISIKMRYSCVVSVSSYRKVF